MSENTGNCNATRQKIEILFNAVERNDLQAVRLLVEEDKVPVTSVNSADETVAHVAAKNGNLNIVTYALQKNSFISTASDMFGRTVLFRAVENGHLNIVKYLIEHHKADILRPFKHFVGRPNAVHLAARSGQLTVLKYFIEEKHADVNAINELSEPLAFLAARFKHHNIVSYLLEERNADLTMTDCNGDNILYMTIKENDLPLMKYILDEKRVQLDVNWRNKYGRTLLHLGAFFNNVNILSYLVEKKHANVTITDNKGETPLHRAARCNLHEACKYLIEHGANIEQKDCDGKSPVQRASNESLVTFMETAWQKRNRRSVPELFSSFWKIEMKENPTWSAMKHLEGNIRYPSINDSSLQNFLQLGRILFGKTEHSSNHEHSLFRESPAPHEVMESRMDSLAVDSVRNLPSFMTSSK